jgi:hypothetical protein
MDGAPGLFELADWAIASPEPNSMAVLSTAVSGESLDFLTNVFIVISMSPEQPESGLAR